MRPWALSYLGNHVYRDNGEFLLTVTLADDDGGGIAEQTDYIFGNYSARNWKHCPSLKTLTKETRHAEWNRGRSRHRRLVYFDGRLG